VRRALVAGWVALVALATASVALAGDGGFAPPPGESPNADRITNAYWLIFGFAAAVFVVVEAALVVFIIRFRSRGRARRVDGPQIIGHTRLEVIWTVAPVVLLAAIAGFVFYKLPGIKDTPSANAAERLAIRIEGHQFYWRYLYPDGTVAIDKLVVPVGRVVTLDITSPDVAHSWWVPALGGKTDAIPGRTNHTWFQARHVGRFRGQCAEFCGIQHAVMQATVEVVEPAAFDQWLAGRGSDQSALGKEEFDGVCAKCHGFAGQGEIGPTLAGAASNREDLAQKIRNGIGLMPPVGKNWSDDQVNAVIDYIDKNISAGAPSGG
jgi:cytochrome c oxidase subunit 2